MTNGEVSTIRALLGAKLRPVGWTDRRTRIDAVGSVWPVADDIALEAVDVAVTFEIWPHMIHAWPMWNGGVDAEQRALHNAGDFLRGHWREGRRRLALT